MPLPPPGANSYRNNKIFADHFIGEPSFQLTPVQKADTSPFLVHMTGKEAIFSIIKGEGADSPVPPSHGFLRACIPQYSRTAYNAPVSCFTESPTFVLDFFRYRNKKRWEADQRFGVGFDKASLVNRGVRPVFYADSVTRSHILKLNDVMQAGPLSDDDDVNEMISELIGRVYPIVCPLGEEMPFQGFIWEREWRHPSPAGFVFGHTEVRLICCPEEEEAEIRDALGESSDKVRFIRAWEEYDDVRDYLDRRSAIWRLQSESIRRAALRGEKIKLLQEVIRKQSASLNRLDDYQGILERLMEEVKAVEAGRAEITRDIAAAAAQLQELQETEARVNDAKGTTSS